MATGPETPLLWKLIEWGGYAVGAIATAFSGFVYKRYRNDRKMLFNLHRKVQEIDVHKVDIQRALAEIDEIDGEVKQIKRNQVEQKRIQHEMRGKQVEILERLSRVDANIEWLCGKHGKFGGGS